MSNPNLNLKEKKQMLFIAIIAASIILISITTYFLFFRSPKDLRNMENISKDISSINFSLNGTIENNMINTKTAPLKLKQNKEKLILEKNKLSLLYPEKKYSKLHQTLSKALDNNIVLYDQTISILSNPNGNDVSIAFENLNALKKNCNDGYTFCRNLGLPIYLEDNKTPFFNYASTYMNEIVKLKRDYDIKNVQKNDFLIKLDKCASDLSKLNEDLSPAIDRVRKENSDLNVIIADVNKKILSLTYLKDDYYSLTVPNEGIDCFNNLGDALSIYDIYINELLSGLNEEIKSNDKNNKYLENAFSKYKDLQLSLDKFNKSYDSYKNYK